MTGGENISVEDLNEALQRARRILLSTIVIPALGLAAALGLEWVGHGISDVRVGDFSLSNLILMAAFLAVVVVSYWDGIKVRRIIRDPAIPLMPLFGVMYALTSIGQKATALGMESGPFLGPLRPVKKRG